MKTSMGQIIGKQKAFFTANSVIYAKIILLACWSCLLMISTKENVNIYIDFYVGIRWLIETGESQLYPRAYSFSSNSVTGN